MTVRMYFIGTSKGSHIGIVIELCTATAVLSIFLCFQYTLYHSKPEMPCDMNHLQVNKSGIKHDTLPPWDISKSLVKCWTVTKAVEEGI